jgi:hypothetical protein
MVTVVVTLIVDGAVYIPVVVLMEPGAPPVGETLEILQVAETELLFSVAVNC